MYIVFWQKETGAKGVSMTPSLRVSFCFFCGAHLPCQVSRTLLQQRYRFYSISLLFSCKQYDFITDLICIIEKREYPKNEKKAFQKEKRHSHVSTNYFPHHKDLN